LYTLKDGKGISSVKLREILWFDKSYESAKNNRGVSMSKLRVIFEKIGEISINGQNSYWTVQFGNGIYCDYSEALSLMDRLSANPDISAIKRLVSVVSAGELLPNLQTEWIDTFKSNFSNRLIDLLLETLANAATLKLSQSLMIEIADAIFVHDSLNEDALKIKCTLLIGMGKNGLAQKTYTSFVKEYRSLFGADFEYTFEQIIS
jgi:two-component SAPR family response regulator